MSQRPPAPWRLIDIDIAAPLEALPRPEECEAALLIIRCDGAPLGFHPLLASELPMPRGEAIKLISQSVAGVVTELLRLEAFDAPAPTPASAPAPRDALPADCLDDALGALRERIAARRARPRRRNVSVVVCTRRRPRELADCLDSVRRAAPSPVEIVVVDNGPDAETAAVAQDREGVRYVTEPRPGLSAARNAGLRAATTDVVAFVDDDVRPEAGWLEPLVAAFDAPDVAVVCGLVLPFSLETDAQIRFQFDLGFGGMGFLPLRFGAAFAEGWPWGPPVWDIGAGANMAVDRRRALALAGFDERLGPGAAGGCGDDSEYWRRVIHRGLTARYEPLSVVRHRHRADMASLSAQARGYGYGHIVALFAQYAYTRDRRELLRALVHMPAWVLGRRLRAPLNRLRGRPDPLAGMWLRGVFSGLGHLRLALATPWGGGARLASTEALSPGVEGDARESGGMDVAARAATPR